MFIEPTQPPLTSAETAALERTTLRKVTRRLAPFLLLLYVTAFLDRANVGFAALEMNRDLGFSPAVFGFGASVFYVGYALCELPSNLILVRVGARRWIARIMITWGLIAAAMMFVRTPFSFYALRILLGVAEAGFFPGIIFYLSCWFPAAQRARAISQFMVAIPLSAIVSGALAGPLLSMQGRLGLAGWQWLFLLEGIPAVLLAGVVLVYLNDGPEQATWLSTAQRTWLVERLRVERERCARRHGVSLRQALASVTVWQLALLQFVVQTSDIAYTIWSPQLIRDITGRANTAVGLIASAIGLAAAAGMVVNGAHSDRRGERCQHVAVPLFIASLGWLISTWLHSPILGLLSLALIPLGGLSSRGPFWSLPSMFLTDRAAAGGIALVNAVASIGGFVGPNLLGLAKGATGEHRSAFPILAAALCAAAALALHLRRDHHVGAEPASAIALAAP